MVDGVIGKLLVAAMFLGHGLAMAGSGAYLPWSIRGTTGDYVRDSWLLGGGGPAVAAGTVIWLAAGVGFILAAVGVWQGWDWWRTAAWAGAAATLLALGLWFGSVPAGAYAGGVLAAATLAYLVVG
jgi:hypothetical protein